MTSPALQLSSFTHGSSLHCQLSPSLILQNRSFKTRISFSKMRPRKFPGLDSENADSQELVRIMMKSFTDKDPLMKTLDKYVRILRTEHCFLLFEELGKRDKWLQCLEVFRWMQKQRWYVADNGIYSKLISVMGKKGQIRMAMWLFAEMRSSGCRPDTSVYNSVITAQLRSKDKAKALEKAMGYFDKMKGIDRCKPNIVTYNILLRAFAQARNAAQVNSLFKDLDDNVVSADIYTYNGVMDAYGKNGMIREMESVLSHMKTQDCKPDIITFNLLIDSYGRKQEFEKMEQVFTSLVHSKEKPTLPTFNSMIVNYGKARLRERAEAIFRKMTDMKFTPSFITYECLIMMYGFCDCVSSAREIFEKIVESGKEVKISTLNSMLAVYCNNGLPVEANMLFERTRSLKVIPDSSTYKLLYKAYTKANMQDLVQKLLKHMDRVGVVPNKRFFDDNVRTEDSSRRSRDSPRGKGRPQYKENRKLEVVG